MIEKDKIIFPLLTSEDIEVKVKQVTKTGALLLLYKTARVDAQILDEVFGVTNWTTDVKEVKGNLYCGIGVRENSSQDFVWKWDCGIESGQNDGQEVKAESSDAFKRAASRLGIGRELYTSPQIWADVATVEKGGKWYLNDPYAKYVVTEIQYNEETRKIVKLVIQNAKTDTVVFEWALKTTGAIGKKMSKTVSHEQKTSVKEEQQEEIDNSYQEYKAEEDIFVEKEETVKTETPKTKKSTKEEKVDLKTLVKEIGLMVQNMMTNQGNATGYKKIVEEVTGSSSFKCNTATEDQYDLILGIRNKMVEQGYGNI